MAIFTAIASALATVGSTLASAAGVAAAGIAGTALSAYGAFQQQAGQKKAEALRERQMQLEADRNNRSVIRQSLIARAQATSNATAQGAGEGSGLAGGLSQITGNAASNIQGNEQGRQIGQGMFAANSQISSGQTFSSIGGTIQSIGDFFGGNKAQNGRVWGW